MDKITIIYEANKKENPYARGFTGTWEVSSEGSIGELKHVFRSFLRATGYPESAINGLFGEVDEDEFSPVEEEF